MAQKKNFTMSKGGCTPNTGLGAPTKSYGASKARNNLKPQSPIKGK